jgi:hypothetical protein
VELVTVMPEEVPTFVELLTGVRIEGVTTVGTNAIVVTLQKSVTELRLVVTE